MSALMDNDNNNDNDCDMPPVTKRVRKSRGQSKNGCFTCRARKIKCDERKPTCARCQQAKLQCEGYPPSAYTTSSSTEAVEASSSSGKIVAGHDLERSVSKGPEMVETFEASTTDSDTQARLVETGRDLLLNSYGDEYVIGQSVLRDLILRFVPSSQVVSAACMALGAATELQQNLQGEIDTRTMAFETRYGKAMALVKQEIDSNQFVPHTIVAACSIFAAIELILRRRQDALTHLGGAYQALKANPPLPHGKLSNRTTPGSESSSEVAYASHDTVDMNVEMLLRIYDFNTMSFTKFTHPPAMRCISLNVLQRSAHSTYTMDMIDRKIVELLHATAAYINTAARKSLENSLSEEMESHGPKYVELLQIWVSLLTNKMGDATLVSDRNHLLLLRNLCMSTRIELQAVFAEYEVEWDRYAEDFKVIITASEELLKSRNSWKEARRRLQVLGFTTQISLLQPVYLAASRYRHSTWRRRAINCLRQTEREGPWIGEMMAAVAQKIMEIEESLATTDTSFSMLQPDSLQQQAEGRDDITISENVRISWVRIVEDNGCFDKCLWPTENSGVATLKLFRRRRPVSIMSTIVLFSGHFGRPETLTAHLRDRKLSPDFWEEIQEQVEFGPD